MSISKNVAFESLHLENNVRTDACKQIPAMVASLRLNGFKENHPLVVSQKENRYLVLCGNRRTEALQWLSENDPTAFQTVLAKGKVPCIVHTGLSKEQEVLLRIDHSDAEDRVALDDWSFYLAVQQLVQVGHDSQEAIAIKLGKYTTKGKPNRSLIQMRVNLAKLPSYVADELEKRNTDPKSTAVRWASVPKLYKEYMAELTAHPNGDGPEFSKLWKATVNPLPRTDIEPGEKALSIAGAKTRAASVSSSMLRKALLCVTGQGDFDFVAIDAKMVEAETALHILTIVKDYLGDEKYALMIDDAQLTAAAKTAPVKV